MLQFFKNLFTNGYKGDSESVIISCFYNYENSPYRLKAFNYWYDSIKHLNHKIIELTIKGSKPQLESSKNISHLESESYLWHKEGLLNKIISELPSSVKYVFWVDADVIFTNKNWILDSVAKFKNGATILQPFEFCVHLDKDEFEPNFDLNSVTSQLYPNGRNNKVWRSFSATHKKYPSLASSLDYNTYGHVGFAWGAKIEVLKECKLYEKALIGGADHVMALASVGKFNHPSMKKSFTDNLLEIDNFQRKFYKATKGELDFVSGNLFHIWHGDIEKRQYLKRIQDFTPTTKHITQKDNNGLFVANGKDKYVKNYFESREVRQNDGFLESALVAYATDSTAMGILSGGNLAGAIIGDLLNDKAETVETNTLDDFGGGSFGGGGAEGNYDIADNFS